MTSSHRELVAVPDATATMNGATSRYRLGVRPTSPDATFTIGEQGPNGQTFPWVYLRGKGASYELDLLDGELTVTSRPNGPDSVQAVVYKIDVESMSGQKIKEGEAVRIVFAYGEPLVDETTEIDSWVATTGPRYIEELRSRLGKTDGIVVEMQADLSAAMQAERFGHASRAPRSARSADAVAAEKDASKEIEEQAAAIEAASAPVVDEADIDLTDGAEEEDLSAVQIVDPATGIVYVGRRWGRGQKTTFRSLKNASYRVAILTLHNGESATVVLQHPEGVPAMQLTTRHGVVRQFLAAESWDQPLQAGTPLTLHVSKPMNGDRAIPRGFLPLAPIAEITATGPQAAAELAYPESKALAHFRSREKELSSGRPMSRNLVA